MSYKTDIPERSKPGNEKEKSIPLKISLLISLSFLASSLSLPFILAGADKAAYIISWAICILNVPVMYLSAKKTSRAVWLTILWFFLNAFLGSPIIPSFFFGIIIGIASASMLISSGGNYGALMLTFAATIAYGTSFTLTSDPLVSLFSLALLIPSLLLGISTKKKSGLTSSVLLCAIGLALSAIAVLIYRMFVLYGDIGLAGLNLAADSFIYAFVYYVERAMVEVGGISVTPAVHQEILFAAESYVNLAPGILAASCTVIAYFSHSTQKNSFYNFGIDKYLLPEMVNITVSMPAAVIFLIAYLLSFTTSASGSVSIVAAVGNNLCLMLLPCLLMKGLSALKALPLKLGFFGLLIAGGLIVFLLFSPSLPMLLALIGAFFVIIVGIDRWAKEHYGKGEK